MMTNKILYIRTPYNNSVDVYNPAIWALESLLVLFENMVATRMVHRDFSNVVANFGDTVNTRRPAIVAAGRKDANDDVTTTDISATPIAILLNQQQVSSVLIRDAQQAKSIKDLTQEFIGPQMIGMGRMIDRVVLGQYARIFRYNRVGQLGSLTPSNAQATILAARNKLNKTLAPMTPRNAVWGPDAETQLLNTPLFSKVNESGSTDALVNAVIGKKFGIDHYMDQNMAYVSPVYTLTATGTITSATGAGSTASMACAVASNDVAVGSWCTVAGDMNPQEVKARTFSTNTTSVTFQQPLDNAIGAGAVLTFYKPFTVSVANSGTLPIGWVKQILVSGSAGYPPQVGQILSTGTTTGGTRNDYCIVDVVAVSSTTWNVYLDRALDAAVADGDSAYPGPAGGFNLVMHPNAIGLISRPLPTVPDGYGAKSAVLSYNGLGIRITVGYELKAQGLRVTTDLLMGIQVLDTNLATVVLS